MATEKTNTKVKVRGLGIKRCSLPHSEHGSTVVVFNDNGIAEVTPEVAEYLLDFYKHSVVRA